LTNRGFNQLVLYENGLAADFRRHFPVSALEVRPYDSRESVHIA
jgi:hypothetical protein